MKSKKIILSLCAIIGVVLIAFGVQTFLMDGSFADIFGTIGTGGAIQAISFAAITKPSNVGYQDGDENMGGYGVIAYLGIYDDISEWPVPLTTADSLDKLVETEGDFVMVANKYFIKVRVPKGTIGNTVEGQGELGGRSFNPKVEIFVPRFSKMNKGLARLLNSCSGVVIIPDDDGSTRHMIGTKDRPVNFTVSGDAGKKAADAKGFTITAETDSHVPAWNYDGPIPLSATVIEPAIS